MSHAFDATEAALVRRRRDQTADLPMFASASPVGSSGTAPAIVRDRDPLASHRGADHIAPKRASQRDRLLAVYAEFPEGLTDEEAAEAAGIVTGAWKRCSELRTLRLIEDTGRTRASRAGVACAVYRLTGGPR